MRMRNVYEFREKWLIVGVYLLFTFLTFIGSFSFAQEENALHSIGQVEALIQNTPGSSNAKLDLYLALADLYENDQRYQEAIWTLREAGQHTRAEALEQLLITSFQSADLNLAGILPGRTGPLKFKVGDMEVFGVFKRDGQSTEREILAYKLDKLLGLNIVPLTVEIDIFGFGNGPFQYFIRDAVENHDGLDPKVEFRISGYPKAHEKMWLLDYLLDNRDRHGRNWFTRIGELFVAIDHGLSMGILTDEQWRRFDSRIEIRMQEELFPEGEILDRLIDLKASDFKDIDIDVEPILQRRDKLIRSIEEKRPNLLCRRLFAS